MALLETAGVPNGGVSFWYTQTGLPEPGPPLSGDLECDVCIVGGGLTGLWTAYYLAKAEPGLRIVVLEAGRIVLDAPSKTLDPARLTPFYAAA